MRRFCCQIVDLGVGCDRISASACCPPGTIPSTPVFCEVTLQQGRSALCVVSPRPRCALFRASEPVGKAERVCKAAAGIRLLHLRWSLHTHLDALPTLTPDRKPSCRRRFLSESPTYLYAEESSAGRGSWTASIPVLAVSGWASSAVSLAQAYDPHHQSFVTRDPAKQSTSKQTNFETPADPAKFPLVALALASDY